MEGGISLIVIGTLLKIVFLHFSRRNIAVVNLQFTFLLLVEDMIVVENGLHRGL